jgi:hypothetical protein
MIANETSAIGPAVERQLARVATERPDELPAARAAAQAALRLPADLGLGAFLGPLRADEKPRFVFRFAAGRRRLWPAEEVVLKVYGDHPRGEGPLQARWRHRGVGTPPLMHGRAGACSWLLMPFLKLQEISPGPPEEWLAVTEALAAHAPLLHAPADDLAPFLRPLDVVMQPRLRRAVHVLERAGAAVPSRWRSAANAYRGGVTPLHGDLALANLGLDPAGALVIYDASAFRGPLSYDAVRWAARATSSSVSPQTVLERWARHEPLPDWGSLKDLVAVECLLEAGSRYVVAERDGRDAAALAGVTELLETAQAHT